MGYVQIKVSIRNEEYSVEREFEEVWDISYADGRIAATGPGFQAELALAVESVIAAEKEGRNDD